MEGETDKDRKIFGFEEGSMISTQMILPASFVAEQDVKATVKTFILNEFLPGEDPAALTDITPLVTTGILNSIDVLNVVAFLENQFAITLEAREAVVENLNTLSDIVRLVMSKKA
jgi:acyl carrier protein